MKKLLFMLLCCIMCGTLNACSSAEKEKKNDSKVEEVSDKDRDLDSEKKEDISDAWKNAEAGMEDATEDTDKTNTDNKDSTDVSGGNSGSIGNNDNSGSTGNSDSNGASDNTRDNDNVNSDGWTKDY